MGENIILIKSINFSVAIRNFCTTLYNKKETVIANQLIRCGLAIGANISEAQFAESRVDFIHKMKMASNEAGETLYWLSVCEKSNFVDFQTELIKELNQIIAILSKIIISTRKKL
jgi:four helix bundle protein